MRTEVKQRCEEVIEELGRRGNRVTLPPGVSVEYRVVNNGIKVLLRGREVPIKLKSPARGGEVR